MRYFALATDYDGTLAKDGAVSDSTLKALRDFRASGRKLIMVTGRELDDLRSVFPQLELFDLIVAENGALLFRPSDKELLELGDRPPAEFVRELERRGVSRLSVGHSIVATWRPYEVSVFEAIRDLNLELQVIFNKGAVMVLPAGVNKASGLRRALEELRLSEINIAGIGDAENDHSFLQICGCAAAVGNALPALKEHADWVAEATHGAGVEELINAVLADDLAVIEPRLTRHRLPVGQEQSGEPITLGLVAENLLIAGSSGAGKSTVVTGILEQMSNRHHQYCIIDPEGDYEEFEPAVSLGTSDKAPSPHEILQVLEKPGRNASMNLLGVPFSDRPRVFLSLLTHLQDLRTKYGRPHWIIVDEAHHVLPASWESAPHGLPQKLEGLIYITLRPPELVPSVLTEVSSFIGVGDAAPEALESFAEVCDVELFDLPRPPDRNSVLFWQRHRNVPPRLIAVLPGRQSMRRHQRKYAEGELPPDRSFYFRGPDGRLNLRAQNLVLFMQVAQGVDDATWLHHLRAGDYSRWFRSFIKDDELGQAAEEVERDDALDARQSRQQIFEAVTERYTLPESSESAG